MKGLNQGYYSRRINRQKAVTGFVFSLPVIIGIIFLFLVPLSQSLFMAFSDVSVAREPACIWSGSVSRTSFMLSARIRISPRIWLMRS